MEARMADKTWTAAEAKARFAELIDRARTEGPQHVTKNGREAVVVVAAKDWTPAVRASRTLAELLSDPRYRLLSNEEMKVFDRAQDAGRPIDF
jgi:antitoxin Phd